MAASMYIVLLQGKRAQHTSAGKENPRKLYTVDRRK